jgi:hypothetical protein
MIKQISVIVLLLFSMVFVYSSMSLATSVFYDEFDGTALSTGWKVENRGGSYSLNNSMLTISSSGEPYDSMTVYREYVPQADNFTVLTRVKATSLAAFALRIHAGPLPIFGSVLGAQLEFDSSAEGKNFLAVWWTTHWYWTTIYQPSETGVWYVLEMRVQRSPFVITYNVYNDSGVLLGTTTATNIGNFGYSDIRYICLEVWSGPQPVYDVDWLKIEESEMLPHAPGAGAWTNMMPSTSPPARANHMMAYDSVDDVAVMFGGWNGPYLGDTWIYSFRNNTWINKSPQVSPSPRERAGMVYATRHDLIILFGGFEGSKMLNETWVYNVKTNQWTQMFPSVAPPARNNLGMAYDSKHDVIIIFGGGSRELGTMGDTWAYNITANLWMNMTPSVSPSPRSLSTSGQELAYDESHDAVLLFGGSPIWLSTAVNDTWAYRFEANTWTELKPLSAPSARVMHNMVYDNINNITVLYGGAPGDQHSLFGDTWIYNMTSNEWKDATPPLSPPVRYASAMVYSRTHNATIMFGGFNNLRLVFFSDTWTYTYLPVPFTPVKIYDFIIPYGQYVFNLTIESSSTISDLAFNQSAKDIRFNIAGQTGTLGFCNVTIPKQLLSCNSSDQWIVTVDDQPPNLLTISENTSHTFLYLTYTHSIHEVRIVGTSVVPRLETHDITIIGIVSFVSETYEGRIVSITVNVRNNGDFTENFNVTAYYNSTQISTQTIILTAKNTTSIAFVWNATDEAPGKYNISAYATPVPGEVATADNTYIGDIVDTRIHTKISVSTSSSTTFVGFKIVLNGSLVDLQGRGISGATVILYMTFPGISTETPLTSVTTDPDGSYSATWIPIITGTFTIRVGWPGNETYFEASNSTSLSVLPYEDKYIFSVESNSTISALAFNTTNWELSFTASGPSGTKGYVKVTVAKSLVENITNIRVYLDGNQTEFSITSIDDSWLLTFNYIHSTHQIVVDLDINIIPEFPSTMILPLFMLTTLIATILLKKKRKTKTQPP